MQGGFKSLVVWQKSVGLTKEVYQLTSALPQREQYALADQMRRAAVSVPSNIAEGSRRSSRKDYSHFISVAHGSLSELETQALIAKDLYPHVPFEGLEPSIAEISRMLHALAARLRA